jgi:HTH-type transcriptional repressor of NAD biosynthesis genes
MSPPRFELGLVVGKFAPLHAGHLHLIETAARQCRHLLILSWCQPEPPRCHAEARRRWLAECCAAHETVVFDNAWLAAACQARGMAPRPLPQDSDDDATQQHFLAWLLQSVLQRTPDAMFASEAYLHPCAEVLSAVLGRKVTGVMVDLERIAIPVSATAIRRDPQGLAHHLPPPVRADFVKRVCLLGGESSGKTTLSEALALRYRTTWVPEYGRELWERRGGHLEEEDLLHIAQEQQAREDAAARTAQNLLFCDTSALTTLFYSLHLFGRADPALRQCAARPYDLTVLCEPDFPFVQDGTRQGDAFRHRQHAWYQTELARLGTPCLRVHGSIEQRMAQVDGFLLGPADCAAGLPGGD